MTSRKPIIAETADGTIIEVFEWLSADVIGKRIATPEYTKYGQLFAGVCHYAPFNTLPETADMFANFSALN